MVDALSGFISLGRFEKVTDDGDAADDTESECGAQYQSSALRVLTHFVADAGDPMGAPAAPQDDPAEQQNFLLGSDWQVEVTQLVRDSLRVTDPKVGQLIEGPVLIGLKPGSTKIQVGLFVFVCLFVC